MKIRSLAVLAGMSAPLILSGSASGGFVGITTTTKPNPYGLLVVNVYAEFDRPGEDLMIAVAALGVTSQAYVPPLHVGTARSTGGGMARSF